MRRSALLAVAVIAASACHDATSPTGATVRPAAAADGAAMAVTNHFRDPLHLVRNVPCANGGAGEDVVLTGTMHAIVHVTINANRLTIREQLQPQNVTGVGLVTGTIYRAVGGSQFRQSESAWAGSFSHTFIDNFRLIGPGRGNNFTAHVTERLNINANGETTADFFFERVSCE